MALEIIRNARKAARMSLERLADEVGVSTSQISRIERGERQPTLDQIKRIAVILDIPLEEFGDISVARRVKIVGYVGAGSVAVSFSEADDPDEWVEAPEGATDKTVAADLRRTRHLGGLGQTDDAALKAGRHRDIFDRPRAVL